MTGGDQVEGGVGPIHEDRLGLERDGSRDAQPLLLAARQGERGGLQFVFDLVLYRRIDERLFDDFVQLACEAVDARAVTTMSYADLGNGFGFWKTTPMRRLTSIGST